MDIGTGLAILGVCLPTVASIFSGTTTSFGVILSMLFSATFTYCLMNL